jgi:hypothetical protein
MSVSLRLKRINNMSKVLLVLRTKMVLPVIMDSQMESEGLIFSASLLIKRIKFSIEKVITSITRCTKSTPKRGLD